MRKICTALRGASDPCAECPNHLLGFPLLRDLLALHTWGDLTSGCASLPPLKHTHGKGQAGACSTAWVPAADYALVTVPLGVLKKRRIRFSPELPRYKLDAIDRLGFGALNKVCCAAALGPSMRSEVQRCGAAPVSDELSRDNTRHMVRGSTSSI